MEERSRAGGPIYRHEQPAPARVSAGDDGLGAAISRHVTEHYDAPDAVLLHPEESAYVAIDVHVVLPKPHRPVYVVVTSGMSERPMKDGRSAELMLLLPPTWPAPDTPDSTTNVAIGRTGCCRTSRGSRTSSTPCCGGVTRCPTTPRRAPPPGAPDPRAH